MTYGLTRTAAPATSALSVAEVKNYLRIDGTDDDAAVQLLIDQATEEAESVTGRALVNATYRLSLADWPRMPVRPADQPWVPLGKYSRSMLLPRAPLVSVASVLYYPSDGGAQATLSPTQYLIQIDYIEGFVFLKPDYDWPALAERPDAVQVMFTAGHGASSSDVPAQIRQAMLLVSRYYYTGGNPNTHNDPDTDFAKAHVLLEKNRVTAWSI